MPSSDPSLPSFFRPSVFTDIGLSDLHYNNAIQDLSDGYIFYDTRDIDGSNDDNWYINFGEYTISNDQDLYYVPLQGSSFEHGGQTYQHIDDHEICVFFSVSEDDNYSPIDYQYCRDYFSSDNVTCHVFKGAINYCDQYNISANNVEEVLLDGGPKITNPKPIDHIQPCIDSSAGYLRNAFLILSSIPVK